MTCSHCGAPVRELVAGRCPFCKTIIDQHQAGGLVIDGRGPIWRVVLLAAGPKPKNVSAALVAANGFSRDQAAAIVASAQGGPRIVVEDVRASEATPLFTTLHAAGAEVSLERRQGTDWVVQSSSAIVRDFQAKHLKR